MDKTKLTKTSATPPQQKGYVESWNSSKDTYVVKAANGGQFAVSRKALSSNTARQNGVCGLEPGDEVLYNEIDIENGPDGKLIDKEQAVSLLAWGGGRGNANHDQEHQGSDQKKKKPQAQLPTERPDPIRLTLDEKRDVNKDRARRGKKKGRLKDGNESLDSGSVFLKAAAEGIGNEELTNEVEATDAQLIVKNHEHLVANGIVKDATSLSGEPLDSEDALGEPLSFDAVLAIVKEELADYKKQEHQQAKLDNSDDAYVEELIKLTPQEESAMACRIIAKAKLNTKKAKGSTTVKTDDLTQLCNLLRIITLDPKILLDCMTALYEVIGKNTFVGVSAANARGAIPLIVQVVAKHHSNTEVVIKGFEILFTLLTSPPASKRHKDSTARRSELTVKSSSGSDMSITFAVDRKTFRAGEAAPVVDVAHKDSIDQAVRLGALDLCMGCLKHERVKTDAHYLQSLHNFLMRVTSHPKYYFNIVNMGGLEVLADISDLPLLQRPAHSFLSMQVNGLNKECVETVLTGNKTFIPNKPLLNGPALQCDPKNRNHVSLTNLWPDESKSKMSELVKVVRGALPDEQKRKCIGEVIDFGKKYPEYELKYVNLEECFLNAVTCMTMDESELEDFVVKLAEYPALSQCFMDFRKTCFEDDG